MHQEWLKQNFVEKLTRDNGLKLERGEPVYTEKDIWFYVSGRFMHVAVVIFDWNKKKKNWSVKTLSMLWDFEGAATPAGGILKSTCVVRVMKGEGEGKRGLTSQLRLEVI